MSKCFLCPRGCGADREGGSFGYCNAPFEISVCRAAPHFWEEPCICGENGSGTVFFSGCNLGCIFCQNSKISRGGAGKRVSESELSDIFLDLQGQGVSNINLVTPTPYADRIKRAIDLSWQKGLYLPIIYNTGGYESVSTLKELSGYVSVYLPDFKYMSGDLARELSGAPDYPEVAKRALREMVHQRGDAVFDSDGMMVKGVIVRHLVLPGHTDDSKRVLEYLYKEYGDGITVSIMSQYTPMPDMKGELDRRLFTEEYEDVVSFARNLGIKNAYIQDGESAKESFIPDF